MNGVGEINYAKTKLTLAGWLPRRGKGHPPKKKFDFYSNCVQKKSPDSTFFNEKKLYIIRPLIKINRDTLSLFVKQLYLPIFYDKSNRDLKITRNYIRKIILPLLKKINPRFEKNIYKFSKIVGFYYSKVGNIECPAELFDSFE